MPRHCAAYGCSNNGLKQSCQEQYISYHRFPLNDAVLLKRWLLQIRRQNFSPSKHSVLCSEHFEEDDFAYQPFTNRREVKKDAVPSIFSHKPAVKKKRKISQISESVKKNAVSKPKPATKDDLNVSGCNKTSKENEIAEQRSDSLAIPPKDDQLSGKWKKIFPRKDVESSNDRMCKLLFEEDCIENYVTMLPDGKIKKIPRNHALDKSSAPTVSPNEPSHLPVQTNERTACMGFSENKLRKLDSQENAQRDIFKQSNDFSKLLTKVKSISTPNSWWSLTCTDDCIIFAKFNSKYFCERRVVICRDLSIKIFLMNAEVTLFNEGCSIENLTILLQKVNDFIICKSADTGTSSCLGFVEDKKQEFCCSCSKSIKIGKDTKRINVQILFGNNTKSVSQVKNINKKITCPKKMVLDLNHELVESKHQSILTKEVFLEAISHLPTEQQTAISSSQSFKTWFL